MTFKRPERLKSPSNYTYKHSVEWKLCILDLTDNILSLNIIICRLMCWHKRADNFNVSHGVYSIVDRFRLFKYHNISLFDNQIFWDENQKNKI